MLTITFGDLRHRRRQFLIAAVGASVVFAMALVLSGMSESFRREITNTLGGVRAERWVVAEGTSGPLTAVSALPEEVGHRLAVIPGVEAADPVIVVPQSVDLGAGFKNVNLIAHRIGGMGSPPLAKGRGSSGAGEAVADDRLGVPLGQRVTLSGLTLRIVGKTHGRSLFGGVPNLYVSLDDGQRLAFGGQRLASAVAIRGEPASVPSGLRVMTNDEAWHDGMRVMSDAFDSIDSSKLLMWLVASIIVAGLVYVSALERSRDFAVLKAMGASTRYLFVSVAIQSVTVCLGAVVLAALLSKLIAPLFALEVSIPPHAFRDLPVVALVVGLLASLAGLRRAATADPALAFGGG